MKKSSSPHPFPKNFVNQCDWMEWIGGHHENTTSSAVSPQKGIPPTTEETKDSTISPQKGILPPQRKRNHAISPRRRRMTASAARKRSPHAKDGAKLVSSRTCTNYIQIHPPYKSFAELFQKRPSPLVPLVSIRIYSLNTAISPAMPDSILEESLAKAEAMSALPLPMFCSRAARISPQL